LTRSTTREFLPTEQIIKDWRKRVGQIAGAKSLTLSSRAGPPGGDLVVNLESENLEELKKAADDLKRVISTYPGVFDRRGSRRSE